MAAVEAWVELEELGEVDQDSSQSQTRNDLAERLLATLYDIRPEDLARSAIARAQEDAYLNWGGALNQVYDLTKCMVRYQGNATVQAAYRNQRARAQQVVAQAQARMERLELEAEQLMLGDRVLIDQYARDQRLFLATDQPDYWSQQKQGEFWAEHGSALRTILAETVGEL